MNVITSMIPTRYLIVNADDFGQSAGVNCGVIRAHETGIVTSASLMVRWPAAAEAATYAREHPDISVGLHLDLGEWIYQGGQWVCSYEVVPEGSAAAILEDEIQRQLEAFIRLMGDYPTHIDSHQNRHLHEPERSLLLKIASELGVPLRGCSPEVRYCGDFYGQSRRGFPCPENITPESLIEILSELPPGITELGCHPGEGPDLDRVYDRERCEELKTLCDPRVLAAIREMGIGLLSFSEVSGRLQEATR